VRVTPLGLRLWDAVSGAAVADGLTVVAYPEGEEGRRVRAFVTASGNHAFSGLPGMYPVESGAVGLDEAPRRRVVVEVADARSRFQPFSLTIAVPVRGLFPWDCGPAGSPLASPVAAAAGPVPLFSTASRAVPAGMAVVRADLWDPFADAA